MVFWMHIESIFRSGLCIVTKNSVPVPKQYLFRCQFYLISFNKRLHDTYSWSALSLHVICCSSCKTQEYSRSTDLLDLGTTSMLYAYYWLTDAAEIHSFHHSILNLIPNTFHHSTVLRQFSWYHTSIEV